MYYLALSTAAQPCGVDAMIRRYVNISIKHPYVWGTHGD